MKIGPIAPSVIPQNPLKPLRVTNRAQSDVVAFDQEYKHLTEGGAITYTVETVGLAGSPNASRAVLAQLIELGQNTRWSRCGIYVVCREDGVSDAQDGWYWLEGVDAAEVTRDLGWANVKIDLTLRRRRRTEIASYVDQKTVPNDLNLGGTALAAYPQGLGSGVWPPSTWTFVAADGSSILAVEAPTTVLRAPLADPVATMTSGRCAAYDEDALGAQPSDVLAGGGAFRMAAAAPGTLHADALTTANAFSLASGSAASLAANVLTVPAASYQAFGHPEWQDGTLTVRVKFATNAKPALLWHFIGAAWTGGNTGRNLTGQYQTEKVYLDGTTMFLQGITGGVTTTASSVAAALTNGTWYWLRISSTGTSYTATLYADNAGAQGAQIATTTAAVTASNYGCAMLGNDGTAACSFGGNFVNVLTVTGPVPVGWSFVQLGSDVASGCWYGILANQGRLTLSVYCPTVNAVGQWQTVVANVGAGSYVVAVSGAVIGTSTTIANPIAYAQGAYSAQAGSLTVPALSIGSNAAFGRTTLAVTPTATATAQIGIQPSGVVTSQQPVAGNTYYWSAVSLVPAAGTSTEVFWEDHRNLNGYARMSNGLVRYTVVLGTAGSPLVEAFNSDAMGWVTVGNFQFQSSGTTLPLQGFQLTKVTPEEVEWTEFRYDANGTSLVKADCRIRRGSRVIETTLTVASGNGLSGQGIALVNTPNSGAATQSSDGSGVVQVGSSQTLPGFCYLSQPPVGSAPTSAAGALYSQLSVPAGTIARLGILAGWQDAQYRSLGTAAAYVGRWAAYNRVRVRQVLVV